MKLKLLIILMLASLCAAAQWANRNSFGLQSPTGNMDSVRLAWSTPGSYSYLPTTKMIRAGILTFGNGLTKTGNNVTLGGVTNNDYVVGSFSALNRLSFGTAGVGGNTQYSFWGHSAGLTGSARYYGLEVLQDSILATGSVLLSAKTSLGLKEIGISTGATNPKGIIIRDDADHKGIYGFQNYFRNYNPALDSNLYAQYGGVNKLIDSVSLNFVPYTGATSAVNLGSQTLSIGTNYISPTEASMPQTLFNGSIGVKGDLIVIGPETTQNIIQNPVAPTGTLILPKGNGTIARIEDIDSIITANDLVKLNPTTEQSGSINVSDEVRSSTLALKDDFNFVVGGLGSFGQKKGTLYLAKYNSGLSDLHTVYLGPDDALTSDVAITFPTEAGKLALVSDITAPPVTSVNGMTGAVTVTNITGNAGSATNWGSLPADFANGYGTSIAWVAGYDNATGGIKPFNGVALSGLLGISSGTYTPTVTDLLNSTAITARLCHYTKIGNEVTVTGVFNMARTSIASNTALSVTLPISSNMTSVYDLSGTANPRLSANTVSGVVYGDASGDVAVVYIGQAIADGSNFELYFTFTYTIK